MILLSSTLYDPGTAVEKVTTSLLAMTAIDTTNLRLAVTVPSHGKVTFRIRCALRVGNLEPMPSVLLGVLNSTTVLGRMAPQSFYTLASPSTIIIALVAEFTVTGLTPGALNCDAAYAVEVTNAGGGINYGGPNDTTTANAWGGFLFEAWDPAPASSAPTAAQNASAVRTELTTELGRIDAAVTTRMATYTQPTGFLAASFPTDPADQSLVIAATDALVTLINDLPTNAELATSQAAADDATLAAIAALTIPTATQNATGLLDLAAGVETGLTVREALRLIGAACAGKISGAETTTIVIRNAVADSKNRITATVDTSGNRSAVTVDLT